MIFDAFIIKLIDFEIVQIQFLGDYFELINECIRLFCSFYFILKIKQQRRKSTGQNLSRYIVFTF